MASLRFHNLLRRTPFLRRAAPRNHACRKRDFSQAAEPLSQSWVKGLADPPLTDLTFGALFEKQALKYGDKEFLVVAQQDIHLSWKETLYRADSLATGLLRLGYKKGDRLGIWMPNYKEWFLMQLATARIGVLLVNFNPSYRTHELEHAANLVGCKGVLFTPIFRSDNYEALLHEVCPELDSLKPGEELHSKGIPTLRHVISRAPTSSPGAIQYSDLLMTPDYDAIRANIASQNCKEVINIQFTSGTTGLPKAAALSHETIVNNGMLVGLNQKLTDNDRICVPVPLYHCFGTVMANLAAINWGSSLVYPAPAFDAEATLRVVEKYKCTALYGVPTMMIACLNHSAFKETDVSSLRTGCMAGSACPVELMKRVMTELHMPEVTIGYGMTETGPVSFQTSIHDSVEDRCGTVGTVHPHVECKVVDKEGNTVPIGQPGELCTKGYLVMNGYWGQPEKTAEVIDKDGFMHSGDQVVMDERGYLRVTGRIKDIIIRGGENISPREVEEFLFLNPAIQDVAVVGAPDAKYGEQVAAFIVPKPGMRDEVTPEKIRQFCEGKIARFKVPYYIWPVNSFPLTVTGKIQKNKLRELAAELCDVQPATAAGA